MDKIAIIGAGGFGREVQWLIEEINKNEPLYNLIGFYDDGIEKGVFINGIEVLGGVEDLGKEKEEINVVCAIGKPPIKQRILERLQQNALLKFPNLIHPLVSLSGYGNVLGIGNIICRGNIITTNVTLGDFIILNLQCTVGHDTVIKDYCSVMPGVSVSGEVILNERVYVGTGAKIINQVEVGENTIIGAGAVVFKSIPPNCTAVGLPAKPIKFNE